MCWTLARGSRTLERDFLKTQPDAVVSVAHGFAWRSAYRICRKHQLPFYLFVHDAFEHTLSLPKALKHRAYMEFLNAYQFADDVFCISESMEKLYSQECGRHARVLMPIRDPDNLSFDTPKSTSLDHETTPLRIGFAGGLHNIGYRDLVERLSRAPLPYPFEVTVYGPDTPYRISGMAPNIRYRGTLSSKELIPAMRREMDVLFCPQSFHESEKRAMATNFPSKLADYTATGLPLLIWGPSYSSSVKWAKKNPGVSIIVESLTDESLVREMTRAWDHRERLGLAQRAIEIGKRDFCASHGSEVLKGILARHD